MVRRSERGKRRADYAQLADVGKLPRAKKLHKRRSDAILYPITVLESDGNHVRVYYDGYDSFYDEWRNESDIEELSSQDSTSRSAPVTVTAEVSAIFPIQ